ncbi:peptide/nickel transport system ATP-binding protein [Constrictibacter sp. MBR-5]|jgi:peptide/nickel transport system ATP-binding protein|uniref:ABC transporter ATP-binding protein n=1 Tax=Constrictibacter sp. MBR-5 TaxID=3156467 RepID=UPI0033995F32
MAHLLDVRDLRVDFRVHGGVIRAVEGVSFRVPHGKTVALVGESGSGKSVTAQAVMGILPHVAKITGGSILFDDPATPGQPPIDIAALDTDGAPMRRLRGGRISIIFQEPMTSLSPLHTVGNQVSEALRLHRAAGQAEARRITEEMLALVGFPDPSRAFDTYPFELSGGLRQRAMIAMALVCRPALLIADEPTTALDVTIQAQILKLIKDLQAELGMAVLMITHDLGVVANVADEVVVLYHGRVVESGPVQEIFEAPGHPYLKALLKAVPRFHMPPGERLVPIREARSETGHMMAARERKPVAGSRPILDVRGITKEYSIRKGGILTRTHSQIRAVDDVSFSIRRGECLGLVGESGCGKTTLSRIIMRALTPDSGQVLYDDGERQIDLIGLGGRDLFDYRRRVQYVFQDPYSALNPRMTVADIIAEPLIIHGIGDARRRTETVRELLSLVGLDVRHLNRYPHSFSGGQRQRIGIARALALRPDLLLCDEPVSALDVSVQAQILNLLKDLQTTLGLTYLFVSHNLAVVDYMADRIAVMCGGRIVELAPAGALFRNPLHPYTKALLAAVPEPDLAHPLDFGRLMDERASNPGAWPEPFTHDPQRPTQWLELGDGHFVRARPSAALEKLVA